MFEKWDGQEIPNSGAYMTAEERYVAGSADPMQRLLVSVPRGGGPAPVLVFFHGGGLTENRRECPQAAYDGVFAVIEPRYRLSPNCKAPAYIEDAAAAIAWTFQNAEKWGLDRRRIFVGGMSAGAYLAAISVMDKRYLGRHGLDYHDIRGMALVSGQMCTHFLVKAESRGEDGGRYRPAFDEYAPLCHLASDLPPMLLVTGQSGLDIPGRPEENALMAASLSAMGHREVRHHALAGHNHGGAFASCGFLLMSFLRKYM